MAKRMRQLWNLLPLIRASGFFGTAGISTTLITLVAKQSGSSILADSIHTAAASIFTLPSTLDLPAVTQSFALSDPIGGNVAFTSGLRAAGGIASFRIPVNMAADTVTDSSTNISRLRASFNGASL